MKKKSSPPKPRWRRSWTRPLFKAVLLAGIWGFVVFLGVLVWLGSGLPRIIDSAILSRQPSITIRADNGEIIARYGEITGRTVTVKTLPPHLIEAVLAIEDRRFYRHFGIDPIGLTRAFVVNTIEGRVVQGGSTLTQQLAKNLFLSPERSYKRKAQEALLALWLEWKFTKDEILAAYLNRVYFGAGAYGVDAAAEIYFNKPARDLNLRESAIIAGLLRAPSRYSPTNNPNEAEARARTVLAAMVDAGYLTEGELQKQLAKPSPRRKPGSGQSDFARYFADWIVSEVKEAIGDNHGDIVVQTTLSPPIQKASELSLREVLASEGAAKRVSQGAVVVLSPDGAIKAMVGGRDWNDSQFNRATQALRQPGSAFKPVIYLSAILNGGYHADTMVEDAPVEVGNYSPDNFSEGFAGWLPMQDALAKSLNTVSVRLLQETGLKSAQDTARKLGLPTPADAGLSYALGTAEVTLLQLTGAYATLANGGQFVRPYGLLMIRGADGRLLWRRQTSGLPQVLPAPAVAELVEMMKGVLTYGTGTGASLNDRPAAGKTGTSQDYRDAWFMGFTADYAAGVWLGNDDNKPMKRVTGGSLPARVWKNTMAAASASLPPRSLVTDGLSRFHSGIEEDPLSAAGLRNEPDNAPSAETGGFNNLLRNLTSP